MSQASEDVKKVMNVAATEVLEKLSHNPSAGDAWLALGPPLFTLLLERLDSVVSELEAIAAAIREEET